MARHSSFGTPFRMIGADGSIDEIRWDEFYMPFLANDE